MKNSQKLLTRKLGSNKTSFHEITVNKSYPQEENPVDKSNILQTEYTPLLKEQSPLMKGITFAANSKVDLNEQTQNDWRNSKSQKPSLQHAQTIKSKPLIKLKETEASSNKGGPPGMNQDYMKRTSPQPGAKNNTTPVHMNKKEVVRIGKGITGMGVCRMSP